MEPLILGAVAFAASLLLLYVGAKKTLQGAVCLANSMCINKVVAGTVVVASITALPELMSSLMAVFWGSSHLALGNLIGSNIYNIPLIIGLCGLIREFKMKNSSVVTESAFMIVLSSIFAVIIILTGQVTWWLGLIFLFAYLLFIYYSIRKSNNNHEGDGNGSSRKALAYVILGGAALLGGTALLVRSALLISEVFGLREFYVGLTITALGCIIPEAAVSIFAALEGEEEISIGNVIGDNIITISLVFGLVAIIVPFRGRSFEVAPQEILTTVPFMVLVTVMLLVMSKKHQRITRPLSVLMLIVAAVSFIVQTLFLA
ncbi:MAG: sodium:calcium antiporter [Candidatus Bathyarchaeia archaeon]